VGDIPEDSASAGVLAGILIPEDGTLRQRVSARDAGGSPLFMPVMIAIGQFQFQLRGQVRVSHVQPCLIQFST
jgi:hypothetical protein